MRQIKFNVSASALKLYFESQLRFYFEKIINLEPDSITYECYGASGNIVHDFNECYIAVTNQTESNLITYTNRPIGLLDYKLFYNFDDTTSLFKRFIISFIQKEDIKLFLVNTFANEWNTRGVHQMIDLKESYLPMQQYRDCLVKSLVFIDTLKANGITQIIAEEFCEYSIYDTPDVKIKCKGYIDMYFIDKDGNIKILDWKTSNSVDSGKDFERQGCVYAHFLLKNHGVLPISASFYYLKLNVIKTFWFSETEPQGFNKEHDKLIHPDKIYNLEKQIVRLCDTIVQKGFDISQYSIGSLTSPFNAHKKACQMEMNKRLVGKPMVIGRF